MHVEILKICHRHAERLQWALNEMNDHLPFTAESLGNLSDMEVLQFKQIVEKKLWLNDSITHA